MEQAGRVGDSARRAGTDCDGGRCRLAILSTPRSGNTWVRHLLASAYRIPSLAWHVMGESDWAELPDELVLQMHWRRDARILERLREQGFRVVCLARHPFDVLISILHVAVYGVESEHWLLGRHGDETPIWGAWPRHPAFLDYATSPRAKELLAVSSDWWTEPGVIRIRYEQAVADPKAVLEGVVEQAGPLRADGLEQVIQENSFQRLKRYVVNNHFWMGQPGLWRRLLTRVEVELLAEAHADHLAMLGYDAEPDAGLDGAAADWNWLRLVGPELGQTLRQQTESFLYLLEENKRECARTSEHMLRECEQARGELVRATEELQALRRELAGVERRNREQMHELQAAQGALRRNQDELEALRCEAAAYRAWAARHPRLAQWLGPKDAIGRVWNRAS